MADGLFGVDMGILKNTAFLFSATLLGCAGVLISCSTMPDTFNRVEANKLRVIGVVITPQPEVSPGDTVIATAYFGGNEVVSLSDVKLAHSYAWGTDGIAFTDIYPVSLIGQTTGLPDSATFSFIIKPDVFIGRWTYEDIPQSTVDSISRLLMQPKDSVAAMISSLSESQKISLGKIIDKMVLPAELVFTAHSVNGTALEVAAHFTVKYHINLPGIAPANNNPDILWAGICKVPDTFAFGFNFFDPSNAGKFTLTYLYNKKNPTLCDSVIDIDTGYTYFLVADNGISSGIDSMGTATADTALDAIFDANGNRIFETYNYKWFYQNVTSISDPSDTLMLIDDNGSACIEMKPPDNMDMIIFRVWVAVYDQLGNQSTRPRGMCVRGMHGVFRYSDAYKKAIEKL